MSATATTSPPTSGPILSERNNSSPTAAEWASNRGDDDGPIGCYLVYENSSGGRLMLQYSQGPVPDNAVGFFTPGPGETIQGFKYQNGGRSDLIKGIAGGDSNRRKYFSGWCQFLKLAVAKHGLVIQFTAQQGVAVDVYGYLTAQKRPVLLELESGLVDVSQYDAVAVMPKNHAFMKGVKSIVQSNFLELGNMAGASTMMN